MQAARRVIQDLNSPERDFTAVFDSYTRGVLDADTGTRSSALARTAAVDALVTSNLLPDNATATISFPMTGSNSDPMLREDVAGRDLNGDGEIDSENHADDYRILPVKVRVEWTSGRGTRFIVVHTILSHG